MHGRGVVIAVPVPGLVLLVGAAGSGKSTFAERHFAADERLSSDDLRQRITGDAAHQGISGTVFRIIAREVDRRLAAGRLVVVDATNVKPANRRPLLALADRHGVEALAIVLDLPAEVVLTRNASRERRVPDAAVLEQLDALMRWPPRTGDALEVVTLHSEQEIAEARVVRRPGQVRPLPPPAAEGPDAG